MPKDITAALQARIAETGPLPLESFMASCIEAYYSEGVVFGADGDFITAPEISQVFGELIGFWLAVSWQALGSPAAINLVELGPGRGTLMADILRSAAQVPAFRDAISVHLVEQSSTLRGLQKETLAGQDITWHDNLNDLPADPALFVGNEFLDALPIQQFEWDGTAWRGRAVQASGSIFGFTTQQPLEVTFPPGSAVGVLREQSPAVDGVVAQISDHIKAHGGCALLIDYGYLAAAEGDSLQAVRRHKPVPVLQQPGMADLTAHVNFASVADVASQLGLAVHGPTTQGAWLKNLGIDVRAAQLATHAPDKAEDILGRCRRLTDPAAMGELFKVIALAPPGVPLEGFP